MNKVISAFKGYFSDIANITDLSDKKFQLKPKSKNTVGFEVLVEFKNFESLEDCDAIVTKEYFFNTNNIHTVPSYNYTTEDNFQNIIQTTENYLEDIENMPNNISTSSKIKFLYELRTKLNNEYNSLDEEIQDLIKTAEALLNLEMYHADENAVNDLLNIGILTKSI